MAACDRALNIHEYRKAGAAWHRPCYINLVATIQERMTMQSLSSILTPAASAARHLAHALATARTDFTTQASKTRRHVAGELDHARDDVGEATTRLSEVLDDTVAAIREASASYRDDARRIYEKRGSKHPHVSVMRRHPYLATGAAFGLGYLALRAWWAKRAMRSAPASATVKHTKKAAADASPKQPRGRRARPAKSTVPRQQANGVGKTEAPKITH